MTQDPRPRTRPRIRPSVLALVPGSVSLVTCLSALAAPPTTLPPVGSLPPLLPVPAAVAPPCEDCAPAPKGPPVEYDRSLLYLPDKAPEKEAAERHHRHHRFADQPPPLEAPPERGWFAPAALLGWTKDGPAPSGMAGDGPLTLPFRVGLTLDAGLWLEPNRDWALIGGMTYISQGADARAGEGVIGGPSTLAAADWSTRYVTADLGVRREVYRGPAGSNGAFAVSGSAGYRFAYLGEDLHLAARGGAVRSDVTNQFHGGEVGLAGGWRAGAWWADVAGRVGLGAVLSDVTLAGARQPAAEDPVFAVFPAVTASVGRQVSERGRLFAGYSFQYLSRVVRPGPALDGEPPTEFWAQGVNLGLRWEY